MQDKEGEFSSDLHQLSQEKIFNVMNFEIVIDKIRSYVSEVWHQFWLRTTSVHIWSHVTFVTCLCLCRGYGNLWWRRDDFSISYKQWKTSTCWREANSFLLSSTKPIISYKRLPFKQLNTVRLSCNNKMSRYGVSCWIIFCRCQLGIPTSSSQRFPRRWHFVAKASLSSSFQRQERWYAKEK